MSIYSSSPSTAKSFVAMFDNLWDQSVEYEKFKEADHVKDEYIQKQRELRKLPEADLLTMYSSALKKYYNVLTASSGRTCIEKYMEHTLRARKIDSVLLDSRLGDSLGDDIACKSRDLGDAKTILISAYDLEKRKVEELESNNCIVDVIIKPVSVKALLDKVQKVLD